MWNTVFFALPQTISHKCNRSLRAHFFSHVPMPRVTFRDRSFRWISSFSKTFTDTSNKRCCETDNRLRRFNVSFKIFYISPRSVSKRVSSCIFCDFEKAPTFNTKHRHLNLTLTSNAFLFKSSHLTFLFFNFAFLTSGFGLGRTSLKTEICIFIDANAECDPLDDMYVFQSVLEQVGLHRPKRICFKIRLFRHTSNLNRPISIVLLAFEYSCF